MFRFSSSRTCLLCTKISSLPNVSKCKQKKNFYHMKTSDKACLLQNNISVQCFGVSSNRSISTGYKSRDSDKNDSVDFSQDPEVKEWLREMQGDFSPEKTKNEDKKNGEDQKKNTDKEHGEDQKNEEGRIKTDNVAMQSNSASQESENHAEYKPSVKSWADSISWRYEKFDTKPSQVIYDYDEERLRREEGIATEIKEEEEKEEIILERGETGVFDVEELVDLLREQNAKDIAVVQVPPELKYVRYLVVVSSLSQRRINALAELVRRVYKLKKHKQDPSLRVEGKQTKWVAMDMGNIALHIMKPELRENYDLETLWTVGAQYDDKCQQPEESLMDIFKTSDPMTGFAASTISQKKSLV